jgi:hypothetical protein
MHPILFDFGRFTLYPYGVLLAAASLILRGRRDDPTRYAAARRVAA